MTKTMPNGAAPTGNKYRIGAKGGKVGQAWQMIWNRLDRETYQDARALAEWAGDETGVKPVSIMSHIHRMAADGILDTRVIYSDVMVHKFGKEYPSRRKRTHIRIPADTVDAELTVGR